MPRNVTHAERAQAIKLIIEGETSQRDIAKVTGLSRPYLKKLADEIGYRFPQNGIDIQGKLCMCTLCGTYFRRPPSKAKDHKALFCSRTCKDYYYRGQQHHSWKTGTTNTFSQWISNQAGYTAWQKAVFERDNYTCQITGATGVKLHAHHIKPKAEFQHMALDVDNGITVSEDAHILIHKLLREGKNFQEAINEAKKALKGKDNE